MSPKKLRVQDPKSHQLQAIKALASRFQVPSNQGKKRQMAILS
jgi:hypothetical protein